MSEPRRFTFQSPAKLPSPDKLLSHLDRQHHVVLQFPAHAIESQKQSLIETLRRHLPEHCSIFDSGGGKDLSGITIKQVVSRIELQRIEEELIHLARHFTRTARSLAQRLAEHNGVLAMDLQNHFYDLKSFSGEWSIQPHGIHICFVNCQTRQTVEVDVTFGDELGIIDPSFFHQYLRTTDDLRCPPELSHHFHDSKRALEFLEQGGHLTRICSIFHRGSGVFAHGA